MLESAADRAEFVNTDDFGIAATYRGSSINGILGDEFVELNGIESTRPAYLTLTTNIPNDPHGNTLVVDDINYNIVGHQPDGTGLILLILERV